MNISLLYNLASMESIYTEGLKWNPCPLRLSHHEIQTLIKDARFQQYATVYPNGYISVFGYPLECIECSHYRTDSNRSS